MKRAIDSFTEWKNKPKVWTRKNTIIISLIGVFALFFIGYIFFTKNGMLIQDSFYRAFNDVAEVRTVEVYSGGTLIDEYKGYYRVEQYKGYLVLINEITGERADIYGASVVVNNPEKPLQENVLTE